MESRCRSWLQDVARIEKDARSKSEALKRLVVFHNDLRLADADASEPLTHSLFIHFCETALDVSLS